MQNTKFFHWVIGILICLLGYLFIGLLNPAYAQSPTATPTAKPTTPTPTPNSKINELKERIASRVAELNLVERRGLLGTISGVSGTKITIADLQNRTRIIDTDELTEFTNIESETPLSRLKTGDTIAAFGLYNKNSRILLARFITLPARIYRIVGTVTEIDKRDFEVTVKDKTGTLSTVNIETTTKMDSVDEAGKTTKIGFTKIAVGQTIFFAGTKDEDSENSYTTLRLIILPDVAANEASPSARP